jgi:hypothetical protein
MKRSLATGALLCLLAIAAPAHADPRSHQIELTSGDGTADEVFGSTPLGPGRYRLRVSATDASVATRRSLRFRIAR